MLYDFPAGKTKVIDVFLTILIWIINFFWRSTVMIICVIDQGIAAGGSNVYVYNLGFKFQIFAD